jgi:alkyl sulfatase BDS1-like metallo-beta-lactamase superfamily hydrolase
MTTKQVFSEKVAVKLNENPGQSKAIGGVYEFNVPDAENSIWTIDLTKDADFVTEGSSGKADVTITISESDLSDIIEKKLNPQMAFMSGKLKVKGNMGMALKLGNIL